MIAPKQNLETAPRVIGDAIGSLDFDVAKAVLDRRSPGTSGLRSRSPFNPPAIPKVIVVINTSFGDCEAMLSGISRFQRDQGGWDVFVDNDARAESDPGWLSEQPWNGVISRTTTQNLVD